MALSSSSFLDPLHLSEYVARLDEDGFDDPLALADMSVEDLGREFGACFA